MACKNPSPFWPYLSPSPLLNPPLCTDITHHEVSAPVPLLMPFPLTGTLMNKSKVYSGTSPPGRPSWFPHHPYFLYHLCTHPPHICRHSNTIPNNHYPCLYLPLFVAPWRAGDAPYSSLFTESSAQDLTPEKHSVHMFGFEFTLGNKTAKIFRSQSVSALPCYETPVSISIHWMLHRAFLWVMTLHLYSDGNKRCRDLECPPVYPHHQEFIKPNTHVTIIFTAFQIAG